MTVSLRKTPDPPHGGSGVFTLHLMNSEVCHEYGKTSRDLVYDTAFPSTDRLNEGPYRGTEPKALFLPCGR